ncbi:hypothetical protein BJ508DRAFT_311423 [Ascobolus immersus RN42]|uniref:Uncharacterized protein n=1 Tax=Ascobolus immersus RN42 TaxID=1160509 RepID=A0A3N4HS26_ASCIM|nr:hypothetical protein BJ508DRAFT_311423 [Ascobolus immersus RN42]
MSENSTSGEFAGNTTQSRPILPPEILEIGQHWFCFDTKTDLGREISDIRLKDEHIPALRKLLTVLEDSDGLGANDGSTPNDPHLSHDYSLYSELRASLTTWIKKAESDAGVKDTGLMISFFRKVSSLDSEMPEELENTFFLALVAANVADYAEVHTFAKSEGNTKPDRPRVFKVRNRYGYEGGVIEPYDIYDDYLNQAVRAPPSLMEFLANYVKQEEERRNCRLIVNKIEFYDFSDDFKLQDDDPSPFSELRLIFADAHLSHKMEGGLTKDYSYRIPADPSNWGNYHEAIVSKALGQRDKYFKLMDVIIENDPRLQPKALGEHVWVDPRKTYDCDLWHSVSSLLSSSGRIDVLEGDLSRLVYTRGEKMSEDDHDWIVEEVQAFPKDTTQRGLLPYRKKGDDGLTVGLTISKRAFAVGPSPALILARENANSSKQNVNP